MVIATQALVLAHLVGFAALFGGSLAQTRSPEVNRPMLYGAWLALLTGLGLLAVQLLGSAPVDWAQAAVKIVLSLVVLALVAVNRKFATIPRGLLLLLAGLTLADAAVAVFWR